MLVQQLRKCCNHPVRQLGCERAGWTSMQLAWQCATPLQILTHAFLAMMCSTCSRVPSLTLMACPQVSEWGASRGAGDVCAVRET